MELFNEVRDEIYELIFVKNVIKICKHIILWLTHWKSLGQQITLSLLYLNVIYGLIFVKNVIKICKHIILRLTHWRSLGQQITLSLLY